MSRSRFILAVLIPGLLLCACDRPETSQQPVAKGSTAQEQTAETSTEDGTHTIAPSLVTFDEWQGVLESMKGTIVVVDFWATWCIPCVERFPNMVKLSHQYMRHDVRFVSLSLDDRDDEQTMPQVTRFLTRNDASNISNYLMDEVMPDSFDKLGLLGVPAVFVYDESGDLRYKLTGDDPNNQFRDEDVENAIDALLAEQHEP